MVPAPYFSGNQIRNYGSYSIICLPPLAEGRAKAGQRPAHTPPGQGWMGQKGGEVLEFLTILPPPTLSQRHLVLID